ncbi:hypothetical protein Hanom_Chr00s000962g01670771 [Helianthus anomalus]
MKSIAQQEQPEMIMTKYLKYPTMRLIFYNQRSQEHNPLIIITRVFKNLKLARNWLVCKQVKPARFVNERSPSQGKFGLFSWLVLNKSQILIDTNYIFYL